MAPELNHHPHQPHFVVVPFMGQGHMIPAIDMARLLAQHGVIVTIVTTPLNALRFKTITDRDIQSGLPLRILQLRFPSVEAGLPEGCENTDSIPLMGMIMNFMAATGMLQEPLEQAIQDMEPMPSCIIADTFMPWTTEIARKFDITNVIFHPTSCFYHVCAHNIELHKPHKGVLSETEPFVVPGLPDRIEMTKKCMPPGFDDSSSVANPFLLRIKEAELKAYGVVVNSFEALEPGYVEEYKKIKGNKAWCVGPVSLCNKELDKAERGNQTSIDKQDCLTWLDSKDPSSVVYVCLGSMCPLGPSQLIELGLALEASNCPFVWVIKRGRKSEDFEKWLLDENFEERTKHRGLIIKGWAPQVLILSHQAIGVFMTHCGWNSVMEGFCAGVPLITWPMFADQFFNEKLVVKIVETGVSVGANSRISWSVEDNIAVMVSKEDIGKAIDIVMDVGEEGEARRRKAREVGMMARQAMEEGGSSHLNMTLFIQDIVSQSSYK